MSKDRVGVGSAVVENSGNTSSNDGRAARRAVFSLGVRYNCAMRAFFVLVALPILFACASSSTPSAVARSVSEGDPAVLNRDCKLLGTVNGRSLFGGADEARVQNAMNDAREKAAAMGATHIVFLAADTKGILNRGNAQARAYRCEGKPS
jgi:hypothetical protein